MHSKIDSKEKKLRPTKVSIRNILVFHKLTDRLTYGSTNYSPSRFATLLESLVETGHIIVSLRELITGNNPNCIAITFDDGYAHLVRTLPRLIERFDLKATIFIPTAFIGKKNSWDYSSVLAEESHLDVIQIAELSSLGCDFGTHGHRHIDLTHCDPATLENELCESKKTLENIVNQPVDVMSYPFGRFNEQAASKARENGYSHAFTMRFPNISDNVLSLGRVPIYFFDNATFVRQKLKLGLKRSMLSGVTRMVNALSRGTTILNQMTGNNGN